MKIPPPHHNIIDKIHIVATNGGQWQMSTMYRGTNAWHIVHGKSIEACFEAEFESYCNATGENGNDVGIDIFGEEEPDVFD